MDCTHYEGRYVAYIRGELGDGPRAEVDAHLLSCASCTARIREIAALEHLLDEVRLDRDPGSAEERFRRLEPALLAPRQGAVAAGPGAYVLAASLLLALAVGIALGWGIARGSAPGALPAYAAGDGGFRIVLDDGKELTARVESRDAAAEARAALQETRYAEAIELYREALAAAPQEPALLRGRGYAHYHRREYVAAEKYLRAALVNEPDVVGPWTDESVALSTLGWTLYYVGRYDESIALFKHLLALHGEEQPSADPYDGLGWCYLRKGVRDLAGGQFRTALAILPSDLVAAEGLKALNVQ